MSEQPPLPGSPYYPPSPDPQQGPANQAQPAPGFYPPSPYGSFQTMPRGGEDEPGFFRTLFDLRFRHFATLKFAGVLYVISIVQLVLYWLLLMVASLIAGFESDDPVGFAPFIIVLVLGWIPVLIGIIGRRLVIEFFVAIVRTAQNTTMMVGNH